MIKRTLLAALLGIGGLAAQTPAIAQNEGREIVEIVVVAPKITSKEVTEQTTPGGLAEVSVIEMNSRVGFDDLDLTRTADVQQLEDRVREVAEGLCEELEEQHPFSRPSTPVCIRRAVEDAQAQVDQAVQQATARSE